MDTCKQANLPEPEMKELDGGFNVILFKDNLSVVQLVKLGLNDRQVKAVAFVKEKGRITNKEYQELNSISKAITTRDLTELVEKYKILKRTGDIGVGTSYALIGS